MVSTASRLLAVAVIAVLLTACTRSDQTPQSNVPSPATHAGAVGEGDSAVLEGRLTDSGGCLTLVVNDEVWIPVFPEAMIAEDGTLRIDQRGVPTGTEVALTGSALPRVEEWVTLPDACDVSLSLWRVSDVEAR